MPTEQQLISLAQRGNRQAMGELLSLHHQRLFNVALRMVSQRDDAAELTQDGMVKIVEHLKDYDGRSQLSTWMIRIVMNLCISHLRKRQLRKAASLEAEEQGGGAGGDGPLGGEHGTIGERIHDDREPEPGQSVQHEEMIAELHESLDRLDDEFRSVLVLRDINEMDYADIAEVLQVPVGTVKSRLFRARLALRKEMSRAYPELGTGT